jgi:hypothetical protein
MKQILISFLIFTFGTAFSNHIDKLELKNTGVYPAIITLDSTYTSEIIYKRAKEWIQSYYSNPFQVLKLDAFPNLRLNGFIENGCCYKSLGYPTCIDYSYILEIDVKEGKYRLTYTITEVSQKGKILTFLPADFFKEDGTLKKIYNSAVPTINESMNELNLSLYKYIIGETVKKKNDW